MYKGMRILIIIPFSLKLGLTNFTATLSVPISNESYKWIRNKTLVFANISQILGRTIRVDHCENYRAPNADMSKVDEVTATIRREGCAPTLNIEAPISIKKVNIYV